MADPSERVGSVEGMGRRRFKRALFGYRRGDVDAAMAALEEALERFAERLGEAERRAGALQRERDELDRVANALAERVVARDRELRGLRAELRRARNETSELLRSLGALAGEVERMREQARAQATRIRLSALRQAAEAAPGRAAASGDGAAAGGSATTPPEASAAGDGAAPAPAASGAADGAPMSASAPAAGAQPAAPAQMAPASAPRDNTESPAAPAPVQGAPQVTPTSGLAGPAAPVASPQDAATTPASVQGQTAVSLQGPAVASSQGRTPGPKQGQTDVPGQGPRSAIDPSTLFDGLVEIEVGPLADFAQLVGFEDAVRSISAVAECTVKRFAKGRATLELRLGWPVALVRELEQRVPFPFAVRDLEPARVVLDVTDGG
jgi:hypothetical protein